MVAGSSSSSASVLDLKSRLYAQAMASSCAGIRIALKSCLIRSDCVIKHGNLPSDCLKEHFEELPDECKQLRQSLFECKRGMVCCHFHFEFSQIRSHDIVLGYTA